MEARIVILTRHGKIEQADDQRKYIGQLDLPLSSEGRHQAARLEKLAVQAGISGIFCSDLARSRETAEIIASFRGIPVVARKDLREISLGDWEGCTFADIAKRFPEQFKARGKDIGYYRVPGGESFADCAKRAVNAFHEIVESTKGNILIVGHAGGNRLILSHILGMPLANIFKLAQDYGCINIIQWTKGGFQVKLVNSRQ